MTKQVFIAHFIIANWQKYGPVQLLLEARKAWTVYDGFLKNG